jgi:hypothetical protein
MKRTKWTQIDGVEREAIFVPTKSLGDPDAVEQLGRELLQAAAEWRAEIAARVSEPSAFKTFAFDRYSGAPANIATWIERPWAMVRHGRGTAIAFMVKNGERGEIKAWLVSVKYENQKHEWKCRYPDSHTIRSIDVVHTFPHSLPGSPTLGDIEKVRAMAHT